MKIRGNAMFVQRFDNVFYYLIQLNVSIHKLYSLGLNSQFVLKSFVGWQKNSNWPTVVHGSAV
jgi:hypothetical protein